MSFSCCPTSQIVWKRSVQSHEYCEIALFSRGESGQRISNQVGEGKELGKEAD